jgi:hypothetical protein
MWNNSSWNIPVPYLSCNVKLIVARSSRTRGSLDANSGLKDTSLVSRRSSSVEALHKHVSITLDQILTDRAARMAFEKLCSKGANRKELEMRVLNAARWKGFRENDPLFVPGISRRSLEKQPSVIRTIAHQIASVGANPNLYSTDEDERIMSLVQDLQRYADGLEMKIKAFRSFLLKHPRHYDMQSVSRRKLLRYVHTTTGEPHYTLVADVLSGAPNVGREEPIVDVSSLRKVYMTSRQARRKRT